MNKIVGTVTVLALFIATALAFSQENTGGLNLSGAAPDEYIVKPGDTLWDISGKFLGTPFGWPELWKRNDYIRDPHWIYPGQKIALRHSLPPEPLKEVAKPEPPIAPVVRQAEPAPPVQTVAVKEPAPVIEPEDPNVLMKLRTPGPIFTLKSYMRTGYIAKRSDLPATRIVAIEGGEVNAKTFDIAVIEPSRGFAVKPGDMLTVLTIGDRVKHPVTGVDMGVVVRVKGIMKVSGVVDGKARCVIEDCFDPIQTGDYVSSLRLVEPPMFDAWMRPDRTIEGIILARNEKMLSIHLSDILYLDIGANDGVRPGDRFAVYSREPGKIGGADRVALGEVEALNVMAKETAVLVVSLSENPVAVGDKVRLTARCRIVK